MLNINDKNEGAPLKNYLPYEQPLLPGFLFNLISFYPPHFSANQQVLMRGHVWEQRKSRRILSRSM
jgi:hypothetical protein